MTIRDWEWQTRYDRAATYLAFASDYSVCPIEGLGVFFVSEGKQWLSTSQIMVELCPLLDGSRGLDELIRDAAPALAPHEVIFGVTELEKVGAVGRIRAAEPPQPSTRSVELVHLTPDLAVLATDRVSASAIVDALGQAGALVCPPSGEADPGAGFRLLVVGDYLAPAADALIAAADAAGSTWMLAKLAGQRAYFGPVFGPGRSACWPCVRARLRANRPVEAWLEDHSSLVPAHVRSGLVVGPAGRALARRIAALLREGPAAAPTDSVVEWDARARRLRRHHVGRRARCPRCGGRRAGADALEPPRFREALPVRRRRAPARRAPSSRP